MNKEEAIEILKYFKEHGFSMLIIRYGGRREANFKIETALDTISNELEKKDEIINAMADALKFSFNSGINFFPSSICKCEGDIRKCEGKICTECIKQFFEKKVGE